MALLLRMKQQHEPLDENFFSALTLTSLYDKGISQVSAPAVQNRLMESGLRAMAACCVAENTLKAAMLIVFKPFLAHTRELKTHTSTESSDCEFLLLQPAAKVQKQNDFAGGFADALKGHIRILVAPCHYKTANLADLRKLQALLQDTDAPSVCKAIFSSTSYLGIVKGASAWCDKVEEFEAYYLSVHSQKQEHQIGNNKLKELMAATEALDARDQGDFFFWVLVVVWNPRVFLQCGCLGVYMLRIFA